MSYSDFADKMLIALYQESENDTPYPEGITFGALVERYGLADNERWIDRLAKEWEAEGLADVADHLGPASEFEIEITGRGMRRVEEKYGGKDGVGTILDPLPAGIRLSSGRVLLSDGPAPSDFKGREGDLLIELGAETPRVDSSTWTGLPKAGTLSREASERVVTALKSADKALDQSQATNEERALARAYIVAIQALADAPEPPADLIWQLVQRANSIAGIAAFFVSLMALFAHA